MGEKTYSEPLSWSGDRTVICDNVRAQNGPGIAVLAHRPGPDLSASLNLTEEH